MEEFKKFIIRGVSICVITAIPSAILLALYFITAPRIAEYHEIDLKKSVLNIFDISYKTEEKRFLGFKSRKIDKDDIRKVFKKNITIEFLPGTYKKEGADTEKGETEKKLYMYYKDEKLQGIGFVVTKFGYGFNKTSDISLFICVGPDLETIKGIEALDHTETPGLGGRITEDEFKNG